MKKLLTNVMLTVMLLAVATAGVYAADAKTSSGANNDTKLVSVERYVVNPLYEDVISVEDLKAEIKAIKEENAKSGKSSAQLAESTEPTTDHNVMARILREGMKNRQSQVTYTIYESDPSNLSSTEWWDEHTNGIFDMALEHTGESDEGDYIKWHYGGGGISTKSYYAGTGCNIDVTFTFVYYTNADQEARVSAKVAEIISSMNLPEEASAYEKVQAIYDYLCANVTYDNKNLEDDSYTRKYSAYAALIEGTSVCQGYALSFYRLALELGVDNRVITGMGYDASASGPHAWNIARIGSRYYNLDSTWDAGFAPYNYQYFLKCNDNFTGHARDLELYDSAFDAAYPMKDSDFVPCVGTTHAEETTRVSVEPTCAKEGERITECSNCGNVVRTEAVPKINHNYVDKVIKEPRCNEFGERVYTCSMCGNSYSEEIAMIPHTEVKDEAKSATCTVKGLKEGSHCSVCGTVLVAQEEIQPLGHTEETVAAKAATCTEDGWTAGKRCSVCNEDLEGLDKIPAAHNMSTTKTPASPTEDGKITESCTACDHSSTQIIYKASKVSLSKTSYAYDGKMKTPTLYVCDSQGNAIADTNYTVTMSTGRKNVGTYTYKVEFKGDYTGSVAKSFTINPKGTTIKAPAALKKGFTAKWAKQSAKMGTSRITGYQVRYSLKSSMASSKTKNVKGYGTTSTKISNLKSKKTYYMQVRTYKTVNGKTYYSAWSGKKSVKTK